MRRTMAAVLLGLFLAVAASAPASAERDIPQVGYMDLMRRIASEKGKAVLVNFWATWCAPCRQEIPHLKKLREEYDREDLVMLGVSVDQGVKYVKLFLENNELNYPVLFAKRDAVQGFRISGVPRTIVFAPSGERVFSQEGYMDHEQLKGVVESALNRDQ
ncbi:TlpA family protein disulfide reductase [Desulfohalovibrio reitneri]|uniref:TlpA family protein disulfide reductase n=1 Tax=Desulfohalovibrio reitneri TaxID=1307759 RepID=UPI0009E0966B|nr:TlpA disulfide reductase family protein [Desulfohalovibrio reitneri]